jgi:hypothetical protein
VFWGQWRRGDQDTSLTLQPWGGGRPAVGGEMVVRCGGDGITEAMGGRRTGRAGGGGFHDGGNAERLRAGGEPVRKARGG